MTTNSGIGFTPVGLTDALCTFNGNARWVGPSHDTLLRGDPDFDRPACLVMGGSADIKWTRLEVSLFVTILLNQHRVLQQPNIALVEY